MPRSLSSSTRTGGPHSDADAPSTVFGHSWESIQERQRGEYRGPQTISVHTPGDYGFDPLGDGTVRMVPSGDIVTVDEAARRLTRA